MPFRTALSGLNSASAELRVIGNNVANASTTGFKKSRVEFADIFASSNLGASSNAIGSGVKIASVTQQFSQGNIGFTDNNLDLAVSGQGMFVLDDSGVRVYSRAGAFGVDRNGFVSNSQGQVLQGDIADINGNLTNTTGSLQLDFSNINPQATTVANVGLNLDSSLGIPGATSTTSLTVPAATILDGDRPLATPLLGPAFNMRDNYGVNTSASIEYERTGANTWTATLLDNSTGVRFPATASIDTSGALPTPSSLTFNWVPQSGAASGAQDPVVITTSIAAVTLVPAAADGDTTAATAATVNNGTAQVAFSPTDASTYSHSTSMTIFDSQGTSHLMTMYFRKANQANEWEVFAYSDGQRVDALAGAPGQQVQFDTGGQISLPLAPSALTIPAFNPGGGASPINLSINLSGVTQFGSPFSVASLTQDGFATGQLSGIDISDTGIVLSRFTNGQTRTLGQVQLANFTNPQGLRQLGDTTWAESFESGQAVVSQPGSSGLGLVQSGALEGSNVDLTEQLVGMITAQRNFQANAQVISTADTITQAIINIR